LADRPEFGQRCARRLGLLAPRAGFPLTFLPINIRGDLGLGLGDPLIERRERVAYGVQFVAQTANDVLRELAIGFEIASSR
jgi:hypothetical protein